MVVDYCIVNLVIQCGYLFGHCLACLIVKLLMGWRVGLKPFTVFFEGNEFVMLACFLLLRGETLG